MTKNLSAGQITAEREFWKQQWNDALQQVQCWQAGFAVADPECVDYCIFQVRAAEERLAMVIRQARAAYGLPSRLALPPTTELSPPQSLGT